MADDRLAQEERLRNMILQQTDAGLRAHQTRVGRYNDAYDVYRANPPKNARLPKWRSKILVPWAQAKLDIALANLVSGQPRCVVHPQHPNDEAGAKAMQHVMDYYVRADHLVEKQPLFAQQALVYGITVAKNHWCYEEDKYGDAKVDRPTFEPWNIYDAWWDPNGRDVDTCEYVVLGAWMTKEQLLRKEYNEETGRGLYRNLDRLFKAGSPPVRPSSAQETILGSGDTKRKGAFLIEEFWYADKLVVMGNRQIVLRVKENQSPDLYGFKPIVIAQTRPDLFELVGLSEIDMMRDIQAGIHSLQNMSIDSLHVIVNPMFTMRETAPIDPNLTQLRPGGIVPVSDHDDLKPLVMPTIDPSIWPERQRLMADLDSVSGITAYVTGDQVNSPDSTATTTTTLASAANTGLKFKAQQLHWKGFQRTFEQWGSMIQDNMPDSVYAKITGDDGKPAWREFSRAEVQGNFHYRMEGSEESLSRQTARQEALALLNTLTPWVQAGIVDGRALVKRVAETFDIPNPDELLMPQQQIPAAAPNNGTQTPIGQNGSGPPPLANGQPMGLAAQMAVNTGGGSVA